MENIKNDLGLKLADFFKERLSHLEDKAINQLKELEVLKYESYLIFSEENNEESVEVNLDEYRQADLFLSYFDKNLNTKEIEYKIDQVNDFSLVAIIKDDPEKSDSLIQNNNKGKNIKEATKHEIKHLNNRFNLAKLNIKDAKRNNRSPPQALFNIGSLALEKTRVFREQLNLTTRDRFNHKINSGQEVNKFLKTMNDKKFLDKTIIQNDKADDNSGNKEETGINYNQNENSQPLKIGVKRDQSLIKEESNSVEKNLVSNNNRKNYVSNNILYESVSNTSNIYNDSFFKTENFSKTILETETLEVNYVLTETSEQRKEKRIFSKQNKSQNNRNKENNFIQKVRDALNFSNTIRNTHLNSTKTNNQLVNKEAKNPETSFYNPNNLNNISIYSKKDNQGSGNNNSKKLVNIPYLDPNTIVKENSPIANMINEYFDKLESKQISKNVIESKDISNMNNIINIGCANFVSNNINNNFSNEKMLKGSEDNNKFNLKETQNKSFEDVHHSSVSVSVDKINENIRNADGYNEFKSPEFGYNNKARSIIKVKKPEDELENNIENPDLKTLNAGNLNKASTAMETEKIFKEESEKNLKQKLKLNLNKINNVSSHIPISMGMNTSRNKTLSYDTDKMDFYLSQKNLKKRNFNRENINEKIIQVASNFAKGSNKLIDNYLSKQAELKKSNYREITRNHESDYLTSRSKTSKNISINPIEQAVKTDTGMEKSLINPESLNPNLTKKPLNLKHERENKKGLSEKQDESNVISNSENTLNDEKKIVIVDDIGYNKNINDVAENNMTNNNNENPDKELNVQSPIHDDQADIIKHLEFNDSALNERKNSEKENKNNDLFNTAISNETELAPKDISMPINPVEHRKNFSFGAGYLDKNIDKNLASKNKKDANCNTLNPKPNNHISKNTIVSSNNAIRKESSNSKVNLSLTNNLNNTSSSKKINSSSISNKKNIASDSLNRKIATHKKLSLEIKTDLIDSINELEINKVAPESTRNSVKYKENQFELHALNKIKTTKNFSKNKIDFIHNNQKEENNELKNPIKNNASKHTKSFSRDDFSTSLHLNKNNSELKEKNESKLKNINKNIEAAKEQEIKASASLDKNISNKPKVREVSENKKSKIKAEIGNNEAENNNGKKLTKNLSIINEKENSDKKSNVKSQKRNEKIIRKNLSVDLDNLNTSVEKDNKEFNTKRANQNHLKFNGKIKESKKEEPKEKDKIIPEEPKGKKNFSKEESRLVNEKSKSKDKIANNSNNVEKANKDSVSIRKASHKFSKSVAIDSLNIPGEKDTDKVNEDKNIGDVQPETTGKETFGVNNAQNRRSKSIKNNNLILNNLNENEAVNEDKTRNDFKNEKGTFKRRSISTDKRTSLKRDSNTNNNPEGSNQTNNNLQESDKKNKRKNAFKSDLHDATEKDKNKDNDGENKTSNNPPSKRNILKNQMKKSSTTEAENDNAKKRMSHKNISKEELKFEKDNKNAKKTLKGDVKERVSSSKVKKVIRPSISNNKSKDELKGNDHLNMESQENKNGENNNDNSRKEINELEKTSNALENKINKGESADHQTEPETRINPIIFDNLIKNIKIDDHTLFKHKEEKHEETEIENVNPQNNQLDPHGEGSSITKNHNNNLEKIEEKVEETLSGQKEDTTQEIHNEAENRRKITFDVSEDLKENVRDDVTVTPKFSTMLNIVTVSKNKLDPIEESVSIKNLQEQFNEVKAEENKKSGTPIEEYLQEKKKAKKAFVDKKHEVFYLTFTSDFIPLEKKSFLFHNLKLLRNSMTEEEKNEFKISCLKEKVKTNEKILSKYLNEPEYSALITEPLKPSKTAKNGLSLFSKEEENNLVNKEQPKEISNFFKFVALLFNQEIKDEDIIEDNLIKTFFKKVIPENMTLKSFFIEISNNIYLITDKNFALIHSFIKESPEVIKSTDLLRKNRTCSYMSFLVKEIYDYYSAKATDGFYIYKLRNLYQLNLKLKDILEKEINNKSTIVEPLSNEQI